MIQQDGYDLDKILEDINKANNNGKQDKFTEKKAAKKAKLDKSQATLHAFF